MAIKKVLKGFNNNVSLFLIRKFYEKADMQELLSLDTIKHIYENQKLLILVIVMALSFYPIIIFIKNALINLIGGYVKEENKKYTDVIKGNNVHDYLIKSIASIYLFFWQDILIEANLLNKAAIRIVDVSILVYATICITLLLLSFINSAVDIFKIKKLDKKTSITLHAHILKILIICCAALVIVSNVLHIPISTLFTSIGAIAAMLAFVFKDTLLGLFASLQLTIQDVIKIGDWIQVDALKANGTIEQITVSNVTIRNFDKTVSSVPTVNLMSNTIVNWRKMTESGGRRIKRAISIDMYTIKVCSQKELNAYQKLPFIGKLFEEEPELSDANSRVTNLTILRRYIRYYLMNHPQIHHEDFALMVRQLDPTSTGIPLEIYAFANDTVWANYEDIQSGIFEHILGILSSFNLKAFQYSDSYDTD